MASKTFYDILGIDKNASRQEIKDAYRRLAHKFHPDKSAGEPDAGEFINMMHAYNVLKDDKKRKSYDEELKKLSGNKQTTDFHEKYAAGISFDMKDDFIREIFEVFFEKTPTKSKRKPGYNHRHYDDLLG